MTNWLHTRMVRRERRCEPPAQERARRVTSLPCPEHAEVEAQLIRCAQLGLWCVGVHREGGHGGRIDEVQVEHSRAGAGFVDTDDLEVTPTGEGDEEVAGALVGVHSPKHWGDAGSFGKCLHRGVQIGCRDDDVVQVS